MSAHPAPELPAGGAARLACIDIGSNTTRLLVAEPDANGQLRELMTQRAFTRIGKSLTAKKRIPAEKIAETAAVVATQARLAHELDAAEIVVVATAAIREAKNSDELSQAIAGAAGLDMLVLSGDEEARLAFAGATKTLEGTLEGTVAVLDVGGGSTEIAIGNAADGVVWSESFRIGSGFLADAYLHSDPPGAGELHALRQHAAGVFDGLRVPRVDGVLAVGGSATSLRRLVGAVLEHETFERALRVLSQEPIEQVARRFELDPVRVRLLPAGVILLDEISLLLDASVRIGKGGLREGVLLDRMHGAG